MQLSTTGTTGYGEWRWAYCLFVTAKQNLKCMLIILYITILFEFKPDPMTHEETKEKTSEKQDTKPTQTHTLIYIFAYAYRPGYTKWNFDKTHWIRKRCNAQICKGIETGKKWAGSYAPPQQHWIIFKRFGVSRHTLKFEHNLYRRCYTIFFIRRLAEVCTVHDAYTFYTLNDLCYCWILLPLLLMPVVYHIFIYAQNRQNTWI